MSLTIKQFAGCVIYDEQGRILLLYRNMSGHQQWELPGGKQEEGESLEEAATREVLEETGLTVEIVKNLGNCSFAQSDIDWDYTWYEALIISGVPKIVEPETFNDLAYWSIDDLRKHKGKGLSPNIANLLKYLGK